MRGRKWAAGQADNHILRATGPVAWVVCMAWLFDPGLYSIEGLSGEILPGALLFWYAEGTTTPLATYSDEDLSIPNTNPVVAAATGRFPTMWMQDLSYKFILKDADGNTLVTREPIRDQTTGVNGLVVSNANRLDAAGNYAGVPVAGTALTARPTAPGHRGEIQVLPNDAGGVRDQFAGGELTIASDDPYEYGAGNFAAATIRYTRMSGITRSITFASLPNPTTSAVYPIEFDSSGGTLCMSLNTNATSWFFRSTTFGGTGGDDVPLIRLGPADQPAMDLTNKDDLTTYRIRSIANGFSLVRFTHSAKVTATILGNKMIISAVASGTVAPGQDIFGKNVYGGITIVSQDSGTPGGVGVYTMSNSATGSGAIYVPSAATYLLGISGATVPWTYTASNLTTTIAGAMTLPGANSILPTLKIGPQSQPAIELEDTDVAQVWRLRVANGEVGLHNVTSGQVPFKLTTTGHAVFANLDTVITSAGNNTPNAYLDPSTGELKRAGWSKPVAPTISNPPTQSQVQNIVDTLKSYGIYA